MIYRDSIHRTVETKSTLLREQDGSVTHEISFFLFIDRLYQSTVSFQILQTFDREKAANATQSKEEKKMWKESIHFAEK